MMSYFSSSNISSTSYINCDLSLKIGMILFIVLVSEESEVFFFIYFLSIFFHSSLSPVMEIGMMWPPVGINTFNPMQIPLLNTMISLWSGISITWSDHSMMSGKHFECLMSIINYYFSYMFDFITNLWMYGSVFLYFWFSMWIIFFMATGFHGIHVIETSFILVCLLQQMNCHFFTIHHFAFEAAALYWHFVDVWLFLYVSIYWWGG